MSPWQKVKKKGLTGRGLHSSTFQLNLSRPGHTSLCPPVQQTGGNYEPDASHKLCLR